MAALDRAGAARAARAAHTGRRDCPDHRLRFTLLAAAVIAAFLGSFLLGRYDVSLGMVLKVLWYGITSWAARLFGAGAPVARTWETAAEAVVLNIRLPRIVTAALVGAALSCAGAAYQGMFRNPMVSPDILGASTGAGFGAAVGILLSFGRAGITATAFCFGLAAVLLAALISRASRIAATLAMVLSGIMVGSLFSSGTALVKLAADTEQQLPAITYWLMGSLASVKAADALFVTVAVLLGLIPLMLLRWRINVLTMGEDEARSLGVNTGALRAVVIVCATLMTAASVAVSGMIGWVGLVIPHFSRMIFGHDYRRVLPASAMLGAGFLMIVDNIARTVTTSEVPLGILTSFVGAPIFIYLVLSGGAQREH